MRTKNICSEANRNRRCSVVSFLKNKKYAKSLQPSFLKMSLLVFMVGTMSLLNSCVTSDRIVNPSVRHTGTANEPGTRIQPYQRADYEYNEQYTRNVERAVSDD